MILNAMRQQLNLSDYRKKHWEGTFDEYRHRPRASGRDAERVSAAL